MTEKELVKKIKQLRAVKPRKDWVLATKSKILGETPKAELFPFFKPAYAGLFLFLIFFGVIELAQSALPGELLYPLKRISEEVGAIFVSEKEKPKVQLEIANKRVEELNKIAEQNQVQKLAPAIKEAQESLAQATKNLVKSEKVDRETVDKFVNLKNNLKKVETTLATKIADQENEEAIESAEKNVVEILIKNLENSTLTEKQAEILAQMKELVKEEKYSEALELYLVNQ